MFDLFASASGRAAHGAGEKGHDALFDLFLRPVPELSANRREHEPVQHSDDRADAECELAIAYTVNVRLQSLDGVAPDPLEAGIEPIPCFRRIDPSPRDDAYDVEVTTPHRQRAHHWPSERCRHLLDGGSSGQRVHLRLLRGQVTLERVLDRRVAQRLQRAKVVTHGRDIRPGGFGELAQYNAVFSALGD